MAYVYALMDFAKRVFETVFTDTTSGNVDGLVMKLHYQASVVVKNNIFFSKLLKLLEIMNLF